MARLRRFPRWLKKSRPRWNRDGNMVERCKRFMRRRVSTALSAKASLIPGAITTRLLVTPPAVLTAGRGASSEAPAFSRRSWMRTFIYVDGFNLYYGALKGTPWKWLDPVALLERVLQPNHRILTVKYFTARVSGTSADPSKPQRQNVYLRAMQHYRPEIKVYFGHFLSHKVRAPLAQPAGNRRTVEIIKTEEKGSDVNLAVHLLNDGWLNAYDCGVIVSNDSDIAEAMRLVRQPHGKRIGLVTPGAGRPSRQLMAHADFSRHIRANGLQHSQLPDPIPGTNIRKPVAW